MTVQRRVQYLTLALFVSLLGAASVAWVPADLFLHLDPSAALAAGLAARAWVAGLGWCALLLGLTLVLGRFFCGYVCPLGTSVDLADGLVRKDRPPAPADAAPRRLKYGVLALLATAAAAGVSFAVFLSPVPVAARLYGLVLAPAARLAGDLGLAAARPLADALDLPSIAYADIAAYRFRLSWFSAGFALALFAFAVKAPRFWCRAVCPAGAVFALCSRRPLMGRRVGPDCIDCGKCQRACPMGAIGDDPRSTDAAECIVCRTCARVCPVDAVDFSAGRTTRAGFSPGRRVVLRGALAGAGAAAVTLTGAEHLLSAEGPGQLVPPNRIRPPGSVTERGFLSRCIRCGACMAACPTNTLQPMALEIGVTGLFSPVVTPRVGPCDPHCTRCGDVCPTGAIQALPPSDRIWARVGTAYVVRRQCLAWEYDRKCLVCDEVCPYGAVSLRRVEGVAVPVPFVDERRCSGCGYCEHHCPIVSEKAIRVAPMEALRLDAGSYRQRAREAGMILELKPPKAAYPAAEPSPPADGLPPGFSD